jgi:hypothetical protein
MEVEILGVMIPMLGIVGIVISIIYLRRFQNEERMAMIDKGLDPSLFSQKPRLASATLRASLLMIGSGFGLLLGYFLDYHYDMEAAGYFSMLLILGGTGLGIAYFIEEKKQKRQS